MRRVLPLIVLLLPGVASAGPFLDGTLLGRLTALAPANPDLTVLTTEPVERCESSGYGWREDPLRKNQRFHHGADYRADPGTPVLAAGNGVVVFAGRRGGYGNVIFVDHGNGVVTRYAHLRRIETKVGAMLTAGTKCGARQLRRRAAPAQLRE